MLRKRQLYVPLPSPVQGISSPVPARTRCPRPSAEGVSTKTAAAPAPVGMPELAQLGRRYELTQLVGGALADRYGNACALVIVTPMIALGLARRPLATDL